MEKDKEEEEILINFNGARYYREGWHGQGRGDGWSEVEEDENGMSQQGENLLRENMKDESGQETRCRYCDSIYHYQKDCGKLERTW